MAYTKIGPWPKSALSECSALFPHALRHVARCVSRKCTRWNFRGLPRTLSHSLAQRGAQRMQKLRLIRYCHFTHFRDKDIICKPKNPEKTYSATHNKNLITILNKKYDFSLIIDCCIKAVLD